MGRRFGIRRDWSGENNGYAIRTADTLWQGAQTVQSPLEGYGEPSWVDEADLNCGALIREWDRDRVQMKRSEVMQSHEEGDAG